MINNGQFTEKEILSQPEIWHQSLLELSGGSASQFLDHSAPGQILVTGCGSTYYLSIWAARLIEEKTGLLTRAVPASELWLKTGNLLSDNMENILIAVSRSGTTSETVQAFKAFQSCGGGKSIAISCDPSSPLAKLAGDGLYFPRAQEKSIAQTRSFSNMMLGISFLIEGGDPSTVAQVMKERGQELISQYSQTMKNLAGEDSIERFFFLGSGALYGIACEAMLKMKEMSLSYSEAYHFLEFRHGPMSMVNGQSLIVGLLSRDQYDLELGVLKDMKELGGRILIFGEQDCNPVPEWVDWYIPINFDGLGSYRDILYLPLLQILSLERSRAKGLDPDRPNNLQAVVVLEEK